VNGKSSIRIRRYVSHDVPRLYEAARESITEVYPWLPWCHAEYSVADAQCWVDSRDEAWAGGEAYEFVIENESAQFLGGCGLNQISGPHRAANLGYWVRSSAAGRGVATQAVRLLEDWAFRETQLDRLEIVASVRNEASIRVAEKCGAVREGIARERLLLHEKRHDAVVFSLLRSDWARR
jgi:RimJ/RimL family protein N-acetyltransferase